LADVTSKLKSSLMLGKYRSLFSLSTMEYRLIFFSVSKGVDCRKAGVAGFDFLKYFGYFSPHSADMTSFNNCSLVMKVKEKSTGATYLITGDAENDRWRPS
jgi:hypothetical protein